VVVVVVADDPYIYLRLLFFGTIAAITNASANATIELARIANAKWQLVITPNP